ncbi:type II secretion system protein GspM [Ferrimonas senticii]|uniref:type II secretion system protein GspM n=1 Tax=Ferrimonas senticii TaxID=394566 RepID=UPI0003FB77D5|nr:type II secretion system protein GspM [Ferrimonas senticii]
MKQQWQQLCARFQALSQRERGLIASSVLVALLLLGFTYVVEPSLNASADTERQRQAVAQDITQMQQQLQLLDGQLQQDPNAPLQQQSQQLAQQLAQLQQGLDNQLVDLVLPEQMAASLAQLLGQAQGVRLIKLQINDSESLSPQGGLYRHGVELELEGRFFDLQRALVRMEQMQRQFYWRQFSYRVTEFPLARLRLQLDTLGTEQEPIRVGYDSQRAATATD